MKSLTLASESKPGLRILNEGEYREGMKALCRYVYEDDSVAPTHGALYYNTDDQCWMFCSNSRQFDGAGFGVDDWEYGFNLPDNVNVYAV